jgi:hypothetical protein
VSTEGIWTINYPLGRNHASVNFQTILMSEVQLNLAVKDWHVGLDWTCLFALNSCYLKLEKVEVKILAYDF